MVVTEVVVLDNGTGTGTTDQDKTRRHPRWTRQETLSLIQAKEITENSPYKGRKIPSLSSSGDNTEPKWVIISSYCNQLGVNRGPAQCRKRWSNLIGDFKRVKAWEAKVSDKGESFWVMRNDLRKDRRLPVSFDREVYKVLEDKDNGSATALSPQPLQAVAAVFSGGGDYNDDGDSNGEDDGEETDTGEDVGVTPGPEIKTEHIDTADDLLDVEVQEETLLSKDEKQKNAEKTSNNASVTTPPNKSFRTPEPRSEQHHQAFQNQNRYFTGQGAFRESWPPGAPFWDPLERGKRRRLSSDDPKAYILEAQIVRALEMNNKLMHAQVDAHNKNCQLEREQRKECTTALVAALGKFTDAIAKIAEKL